MAKPEFAPQLTKQTVLRLAQDRFGDESFTRKDASEVAELETNRWILSQPEQFNPCVDLAQAARTIDNLEQYVNTLPTQTASDEESEAFQQFSTPPHYAYLAAWAANLRKTDVVLEPSAGNGGLAMFAMNAGCSAVLVNELSERRADNLRELGFDNVYSENAEQLDNVLPDSVMPSVVLMNPPFSQTAGRLGDKKVTQTGAIHVSQCLLRLQDQGRLVCIMGRGMSPEKPTFQWWWKEVQSEYNVRAVIGIPGDVYRKYGTAFGSVLAVIDKTGPTRSAPLVMDAPNLSMSVGLLHATRMSRPEKLRSVGLFAPAIDLATKPLTADKRSEKPATIKVRAINPTRTAPEPTKFPACEPIDFEVIAAQAQDVAGSDIFETYRPARLRIPGARPHPTPLVQSVSMASVLPPEPTYRPRLPKRLIEEGLLSEAQLEAVVYAGQAHQQWLEPQGDAEPCRKGWMCGDSMGVGKGRTLCAIIMDSFAQGETKAVWITKNNKLLTDGVRDWLDLGGSKSDIIPLEKVKLAGKIPDRPGVLFATYGLLRSGTGKRRPPKLPKIQVADLPDEVRDNLSDWRAYGLVNLANRPSVGSWFRYKSLSILDEPLWRRICAVDPSYDASTEDEATEVPDRRAIWQALGMELPKEKENEPGKSRLSQILEWLGDDFSGCIAFDEAHYAKNSLEKEE